MFVIIYLFCSQTREGKLSTRQFACIYGRLRSCFAIAAIFVLASKLKQAVSLKKVNLPPCLVTFLSLAIGR